MTFEKGYLILGHWRGARIRAHWTLPLGAFIFGQTRFVPGFWLGFFLIILIHEMGHALLVRRGGFRVLSIDINGFGGECRWNGESTALDRAIIGWGGVTAQAAALFAAVAFMAIAGEPETAFSAQLARAFTATNVWLIAFNLLPIAPLDGAQAWKLLPLLRDRRRRQ